MLSKIPIKNDLSKMSKAEINNEILRMGIIAELAAIILYEQMAAMTTDEDIKKILLDVAKEEKTHVGEFQALLLEGDKEQVEELAAGKKEVEEELKK